MYGTGSQLDDRDLGTKAPATVRGRYNGLESAHIAADAVRRTKGLRSERRTRSRLRVNLRYRGGTVETVP
jgi:hypothetical protein